MRTPWAKFQGQLARVSAWKLGQMATDTAVKQSAVPLEDIKHIIMTESPLIQKDQDFIFSDFLKKTKYCCIEPSRETNFLPLLKALDILKSYPESAVVVGGMESATQQQQQQQYNILITNLEHFPDVSHDLLANYIEESNSRFLNAQKENVYESEVVGLTVKHRVDQRNVIKDIKQDEIYPKSNHSKLSYSDGASAVVLCTRSKAQKLNLKPLVEVIAYESVTNTQSITKNSVECIDRLFAKCPIALENIHHWEIDDCMPQIVVQLRKYFKLNMEIINPHGGSLIMGYSPAATVPRLITHLTHALKPQQNGCLVSFNSEQTLGLIIKKL